MKTSLRTAVVVLLALAVLYARLTDGPADVGTGQVVATEGAGAAREAFEAGRSKVWMEVAGRVERELSDDLEGSRHQRFLLELEDGLTLLVSHNIDLAQRVPLRVGDPLLLRGRYEWNDKGGVLHWTHHDPDGRLEGGWIELAGRRFE